MHQQRRPWVRIACVLGGLLLAGTLQAADEKAAALAEINQTRQLLGLPGVTSNPLLDQAAQAHADYLQTHLNGISHDETPGLSGFTGTTPGARLTTAGYAFSTMNEVISGGIRSGIQAVQGLVQAIYHRFGILAPAVAEAGIGIGTVSGKLPNTVIDFGATLGNAVQMPAQWLGTYPVDGQTGVTRDFYSDNESPDPVPDLNRVGYPVSIHAGAHDTLTVSSFTLTPLVAGGQPLPSRLLTSPTDPHVPAYAAAMIPLAPLDYGVSYQASFSGTRNGQAVHLNWTFTTIPYSILTLDPPYQRIGTDQVAHIKVSGGNGSVRISGSNWLSAKNLTPSVTEVSLGLFQVSVPSSAEVTVRFADQDGQTLSAKVSFVDPISETTTMVPGWNLLGNPLQAPIVLADRLGRVDQPVAGITDKVISVWKYLPAHAQNVRWAFYTPTMTAAELANFAASKGYAVLDRVDPGEGYWVYTHAALTLPARTGIPVSTLPAVAPTSGWSLHSAGNEAVTPAALDKALGVGAFQGTSLCFTTGGSTGECWQVSGGLATTPSFQSLWTWDGTAKKWRYYAPDLALRGGTALGDYAAANGLTPYDLAEQQYLHMGEGFWIASLNVTDTLPPSVWDHATVTPVTTTTSTTTSTSISTTTTTVAPDTTTSTSTTTTTTVALTTPTTQVGTGSIHTLNLQPGWNLLGNGSTQPMTVATLFGDATRVATVWKWDANRAGWQFYTPSMDATTLQAYTTGKGYAVLSTIRPGDGFWVNVKAAMTLTMPTGTAFDLTAAGMRSGWNLVATGNDVSPPAFHQSLGTTPQAAGTAPIRLITLWAWNASTSQWYFYAPDLDQNGSLASYIASKGYLDFSATGKTLGKGIGFWVNKP